MDDTHLACKLRICRSRACGTRGTVTLLQNIIERNTYAKSRLAVVVID